MAKLVKLETAADMLFTPPAGYVTSTIGTDEEGLITELIKKSDGTITSIGGGGGSSEGYVVVEDGGVLKAQKLSFDGTVASPDGSAEEIGSVGIFNTGMDEPAYKGMGGGSFYKCASVDSTAKTWTGYEAIQAEDGTWSFADTVTSGLEYGIGYIPVLGNIYNSNATATIDKLFGFSIIDYAVFYAPLTASTTTAETGQTIEEYNSPEFITHAEKKCVHFNQSAYLLSETTGVLTNQSPRTYSVEVYRGGSVHMKYVFSHGGESDFCFRCYTTNNGLAIWSSEGWDGMGSQLPQSWTRLTIVYTGTQWLVYFGSELKLTIDHTVTQAASSEVLSIGSHFDGGGAYDGYMRNFVIFDKALTVEEIQQLSEELV